MNVCENDITRLYTFGLCKLCTALECKIQDLLVFVSAEKELEK
ncbi:MAG: helix-turn-helix domain-containing protein [Dorea sp.]|nr:helix-turn-helix domain-containing protein [Dorea sp.]MCI9452796.1 helix-turn-helix domain-containing protein [Dorea sp.]